MSILIKHWSSYMRDFQLSQTKYSTFFQYNFCITESEQHDHQTDFRMNTSRWWKMAGTWRPIFLGFPGFRFSGMNRNRTGAGPRVDGPCIQMWMWQRGCVDTQIWKKDGWLVFFWASLLFENTVFCFMVGWKMGGNGGEQVPRVSMFQLRQKNIVHTLFRWFCGNFQEDAETDLDAGAFPKFFGLVVSQVDRLPSSLVKMPFPRVPWEFFGKPWVIDQVISLTKKNTWSTWRNSISLSQRPQCVSSHHPFFNWQWKDGVSLKQFHWRGAHWNGWKGWNGLDKSKRI